MIDQICRSRLAGDPPDVMVDLDLSHLSVLAFFEAETAIQQGYAAMKDYLPRVPAERRTFSWRLLGRAALVFKRTNPASSLCRACGPVEGTLGLPAVRDSAKRI